jgi:hypothetical protein
MIVVHNFLTGGIAYFISSLSLKGSRWEGGFVLGRGWWVGGRPGREANPPSAHGIVPGFGSDTSTGVVGHDSRCLMLSAGAAMARVGSAETCWRMKRPKTIYWYAGVVTLLVGPVLAVFLYFS